MIQASMQHDEDTCRAALERNDPRDLCPDCRAIYRESWTDD